MPTWRLHLPIKEALFWVGITVFGTGLFFLVEGGNRMPLAVTFTIIGLAAIAYSVYSHHQPDAKTRLPIWASLLLLTWLAIGYDYYDRHTAVRYPDIAYWEMYPKKEVVRKTFQHERVIIDGQSFLSCAFDNVTLVYNGTAP